MLRPLYCQQYSPLPCSRVGPLLLLALHWWNRVLDLRLEQSVPIQPGTGGVAELFCDARGVPAHIGAVLVLNGKMYYTDWAPPEEVLKQFSDRGDNQIMGSEIVAAVVGIATFARLCSGRCLRVWSDNTGAEGSLRKKGAERTDHNLLVHAAWLLAAQANVGLWIERVGTKDNVADDPSRQDFRLLQSAGAKYVRPELPEELWELEAWIRTSMNSFA